MSVDAGLLQRYGDWALVTGASSGMGEAFARQLAARGFNVLITARRMELLAHLQKDITHKHNVKVEVVAADLAVAADVVHLIEKAKALRVSLLISNAGFGLKGEFVQDDLARQEAMYLTNCVHPSRILHALLPDMIAKKRGGIIVTGSIEGESVFPLSAAYCASKAFLHNLTQSLWYELKPHGIDVLLLSPGSTDTDAPIKQGISREQLVGLMSPEDVVAGALQALGKQPIFIPGFHNRLFVGLLRLLPRKLSINMAGMGMQRAIEKSK